jgi:predicted transcriptional regulator
MIDTDAQVSQVIFALANTTRRRLLERLADCDGQRLKELCVDFDISRQATMKHIEQLEMCGLVTVKRSERETRIFLNRAPIQLVQRSFFEQFA